MKNKNVSSEKGQQYHQRVPLIIDLPSEDPSHFEILNSSQSLTTRSGLVTLQPGEEVGVHSTEKNEELILVLEGYAEVETEKLDRQKISNNNVVYIPPFTKHNVFNIGSQLLRYIYIVTSV